MQLQGVLLPDFWKFTDFVNNLFLLSLIPAKEYR